MGHILIFLNSPGSKGVTAIAPGISICRNCKHMYIFLHIKMNKCIHKNGWDNMQNYSHPGDSQRTSLQQLEKKKGL